MNCAEPFSSQVEAETVLSPLEWFGQRREQRGRLGFNFVTQNLLGFLNYGTEIHSPQTLFSVTYMSSHIRVRMTPNSRPPLPSK